MSNLVQEQHAGPVLDSFFKGFMHKTKPSYPLKKKQPYSVDKLAKYSLETNMFFYWKQLTRPNKNQGTQANLRQIRD